MGGVIKKFIPKTIDEKYPKLKTAVPTEPVLEQPTTKPSITKPVSIKPMEEVTATQGPSTTEVDMASGMDGIADSLERKKKGRSKTILTGSQGLGDKANTVAPTLLG